MKKPGSKLIPLLASGIVPAATVTSAFLSPLVLAETGDLDPAFGDVGRLGPILNGPAWSLELQEDGTMLLAGGQLLPFYYYWGYVDEPYATNFVNLLSDTGSIDLGFEKPFLADIQVLDVVRQPDGQVVAVGRKVGDDIEITRLIAFRLQSAGPLDTTFADAGVFELSVADHGNRHIGTSVVLDPDGRIVVAGSRDNQVIAVRLLPDGSLDNSFGTSGVFAGPDTFDFSDDYSGARTSLLRTAAGGYRLTASNAAGCQIIALTAGGMIDNTFGTSGVATVAAPMAASTYCNSMASQANGRLLVAGSTAGQGFAARMLANGQPDPGFSADIVSTALADATAVAAGENGMAVVAGRGVSGASIMRLQANGELDALFGNAGSTLIDLRSESGTSPVVHDLTVRADGGVVAAGGEDFSNQAFVVRLLGDGGGDSPGVLGIAEQANITTAEGTDEVVMNVRRTGGASGTVSVAYQTAGDPGFSAVPGQDYDSASGRLTWSDGDRTDRQIHVPILSDNTNEEPEFFQVELSDFQGGAGLGTSIAFVEIAADGGPFGQFNFPDSTYFVPETASVGVGVSRDYFSSGAVSVTLTPVTGTATAGGDFVADPVTLSWADGESGFKFANISTVDDTFAEQTEIFSVELSNATGGAVIGPRASTTVQIVGNDQPPRPRPRPAEGGGGAFGFLSLLLLGIMNFLRSPRKAMRCRRDPASGKACRIGD
jgi:uncharacterized delta-60 repeat protein